MNKQEKIICFILGLLLVWTMMSGSNKPAEEKKSEAPAETAQAAESAAATNGVSEAVAPAPEAVATNAVAAVEAAEPPAAPAEPDVWLENDELKVGLSSAGAVVCEVTLKQYAENLGEISEENPPLRFDYSYQPLGRLSGVEGLSPTQVYEWTTNGTSVTFATEGVSRTYTLAKDYRLTLDETFAEGRRAKAASELSMGCMARGGKESDLIALDSRTADGTVVHHDDDSTRVKFLLTGVESGGCGACSCSGAPVVAPGTPLADSVAVAGALDWVAVKNRFFVTACVSTSQPATGFRATVWRDPKASHYKAERAGAAVCYEGGVEKRSTTFFIGPKRQSLLWDHGMKDVMEFGMWRWVCYPMLWLLNLCYSLVPSYGVAVILLTVIVRLVFWPLTRKSTEGMKKMQEIQPLLKELQAKFKDNPQRLQQETFALYREKKVNPFSSCLPMLIQIPVFIALFNVLRSSVELRYAGFLWIADLSEPEHLFASWFPFGGLNILPVLMALTMFLQSRLTPSAGDPGQQKMMSVFMPILMLVMFYNFASALSLYWTLSQVISIVQMWMIRRAGERKTQALEPEVIDPPTPTRQQRRHT